MTEQAIELSGVEPAAHLRADHPAAIETARLCAALTEPSWLGRAVDAPIDRPDLRRVETDLSFRMRQGGGSTVFRKAAFVDLGPPTRDASGLCVAEIGWRAASFAPLFPVFAGRLEVGPRGLSVDGYYAPPGGGVGLVIDRVFLHYFARRTASWFLDRLATEIRVRVTG